MGKLPVGNFWRPKLLMSNLFLYFESIAFAPGMPHTGYMNNCCWNIENNYPTHNPDCLTAYGPQFRDATMAVTFTDGETIVYKNVRVCINRPSRDGIGVDGTTLKFEAGDTCFTLLGVRQYVYEIDGPY
jgi:hypothetical protein